MQGFFDGWAAQVEPVGWDVGQASAAVEDDGLWRRPQTVARSERRMVAQVGLAAHQYGSLFGAPAVVESVLPLCGQPILSNRIIRGCYISNRLIRIIPDSVCFGLFG